MWVVHVQDEDESVVYASDANAKRATVASYDLQTGSIVSRVSDAFRNTTQVNESSDHLEYVCVRDAMESRRLQPQVFAMSRQRLFSSHASHQLSD